MLTAPEYDDYLLEPVLEHRTKALFEGGSAIVTTAAAPQVIDEGCWLSQFAEIDALDLDNTVPNRYLTEEPALPCSWGGGWGTCPEFVPADRLIDGLCPTHAQSHALSESDLDELDAVTWRLEDEAEERWRERGLL